MRVAGLPEFPEQTALVAAAAFPNVTPAVQGGFPAAAGRHNAFRSKGSGLDDGD
ncbi:hypothetical protein [Streptomyces sp. NPDC058583]|uniref:hypothetical protein n=1 Tax=unclassified Streptomyces TaxID=2593676 RepID=UPI00365AC502